MNVLLSANKISLKPRLTAFSLDLSAGQVIGLLGVNGAGKSTALSLLAGGQAPSNGEISLAGQALSESNRQRIGWLPQQSTTYPEMTVDENLSYTAAIHGLKKNRAQHAISAVIEQFSLSHLRQRLSARLSGGERRRLDLACTLLHSPDVLLLDEPTAGLDPLQAEHLRQLIKQLSVERGIVLASHLLPDIEQLCSHAILMDAGRVIESAAIRLNQHDMQAVFSQPPSDSELLNIFGIEQIVSRNNNTLILRLKKDAPKIMPEKLSCHGWGLQSWQPAHNNILQRFRALSIGETQ